MSWVRAGSILAALAVHATVAAAFMSFGATQDSLENAAGRDDLSVVATVTMQNEESIGLDPVTAERQDASAASNPVPEVKQQEAKREDAIEMDPPPPEESAPPQAPIQPKPVEKPVERQEAQSTAPSIPAPAQQEQHAMSRELEARRSQLVSLYNAQIHRAILTHRVWPKDTMAGHVWVELTLSPAGKLLAHRIVKSSGGHLLEATAKANLESIPFPPPPDGLVTESYSVTFRFDYTVQ